MKYRFKETFIACLCKDTNNGIISNGQILCIQANDNQVYDLINKKFYPYLKNLKGHYQPIDESIDNEIYALYFKEVYNHTDIFSHHSLLQVAREENEKGLSIAIPENEVFLFLSSRKSQSENEINNSKLMGNARVKR